MTSGLSAHRSDRSAEFLLLVVVVIWALNYPLTKYGLSGLDVYVFNSIRFVVAFAMLLVILIARREWFRMPKEDRRRMLRLGVLVSIVYQLAFIIGISNTSAGNASVILSTSPIWTAIFGARMNRERLPRQTYAGMAVSLTGIVLIILGSSKRLEFGGTAILGDLICLAAAMLWALSTNLQRPLLMRYSTVQLSVVTVGVGAAGLSAIGIPSLAAADWTRIPTPYFVAAILSGALSIGIANVLWSYGVKRIGPSRTANFNNLVPVLAFTASAILLDEPVTWLQVGGAVVTICGVAVARRH